MLTKKIKSGSWVADEPLPNSSVRLVTIAGSEKKARTDCYEWKKETMDKYEQQR